MSQHHIKFTLHAGEASDGANVFNAIQSGASRIGHGVRSNECDKAIKAAVQSKILFEMCPTSNI